MLFRWLFGEGSEVLHDRDFQMLLLANLLPPMGTALFSPILESLIDPLGTTASDVGLLMSFFTAPPILVIPVAGALSDRYGRKPILVGSLLLFGGAGTAIAFTTDFHVALGLRLLQGVAFGGLTPVIVTSIGDLYGAPREATAQGLRFMGSGLTQTVFPLLAGALVVVGWTFPFLLYTVAFPVAVFVALYLEEPQSTGETATDGGDPDESYIRALFGLARQPRVLALVVARGIPVVVWIAFLTYNSIVVNRLLGGTPTQAGMLVAAGSLAYAAGASQAGRLTALLESRLSLLVAGHVAMGVGFAGFLYAPTLLVAGVGIVVSGVGFGLSLALYRSVITGLAGEELRGGVVSLAESFGRTAATITPIAMGAVIAAAAPDVGLGAAVRLAGLGAAAVGTLGGLGCLLVATVSPGVEHSS